MAKKDTIKILIRDNKTQKAIDLLLKSFKKQNEDLYNETVLVTRRYEEWKSVDRTAQIKPENHDQENRAIHFALIELTDELKDSFLKRYLWGILAAAASILAIIFLASMLLGKVVYKGIISDPAGNRIPEAKVALVGSDKQTHADQDGVFILKTKPSKEMRKIVVSKDGYQLREFRIQAWKQGATIPNFELEKFNGQ